MISPIAPRANLTCSSAAVSGVWGVISKLTACLLKLLLLVLMTPANQATRAVGNLECPLLQPHGTGPRLAVSPQPRGEPNKLRLFGPHVPFEQ